MALFHFDKCHPTVARSNIDNGEESINKINDELVRETQFGGGGDGRVNKSSDLRL